MIAQSSIIHLNLHTRMASNGDRQHRAILIRHCRSYSRSTNTIHRYLCENRKFAINFTNKKNDTFLCNQKVTYFLQQRENCLFFSNRETICSSTKKKKLYLVLLHDYLVELGHSLQCSSSLRCFVEMLVLSIEKINIMKFMLRITQKIFFSKNPNSPILAPEPDQNQPFSFGGCKSARSHPAKLHLRPDVQI